MKKCFPALGIFLAVSCWTFGHEYIMDDGLQLSSPLLAYTQITTLTGGTWDNGYYDMVLPDDNQFYFYGKKVTHLRIWTNGYITCGFGSVPTDYSDPSPDVMPNSDAPNAYIAPWWDDWDLSVNGRIYYRIGTGGPGGNNWVTVKWEGVPHHDDATAGYTFAVSMVAEYHAIDTRATRDEIIFNYGWVASGTGVHDFGRTGTVGIEHDTGWQCEEYSHKSASLSNGLSILFTPFVPVYDSTDYDGNGVPEVAVWRPDDGSVYCRYENGSTSMNRCGKRGDIYVPGDYDGDVKTDDMVYRPSTCEWRSINPFAVTYWGTHGDIPVPADYDDDGKTDIAVWRPSNGCWYIRCSSGAIESIPWGTQGDIPLPADYDNDGKVDLAVYRTSTGVWWIRKSSDPATAYVMPWGTDGDVPTPFNYFDAAYLNPCVYRPSNGGWYIQSQMTGGTAVHPWGADYDVPVPSDIQGGSLFLFIVWRPSNGVWYEKSGTAGFAWGAAGDKPRCRKGRIPGFTSPGYQRAR